MNNPYDDIVTDYSAKGGGSDSGANANPYDSQLDDDLRKLETLTRQRSMQAAMMSAGEAKRNKQLSDRVKLPTDLIGAVPEYVEQNVKAQDIHNNLSMFPPDQQRWFLENQNLESLQDDLPRLNALAKAIDNREWYDQTAYERNVKAPVARGLMAVKQAVNRYQIGDALQSIPVAEKLLSESQADGYEDPYQWYTDNSDKLPQDMAGAVAQFQSMNADDLRNYIAAAKKGLVTDINDYTLAEQAMQGIPMDPDMPQGKGAIDTIVHLFTENPGAIPRETITSLVQSSPALAMGYLTGGGSALATMGAAGAGSFLVEEPAKLAEVMRDEGVDLTDPDQVYAAFTNPELMAKAQDKAFKKAAGTAGVDALMAFVGGRMLMPSRVGSRTLTQAERNLGNQLAQVPLQAAGEGAGEALGQYAAEGRVDAGEVALETIIGGATGPVEVLAYGAQHYRRGKAAKEYLASVAELANEARKGNATEEQVREFIANAKQRGPVSELYIDAQKFSDILEQGGLNPEDIVARMPSVTEQYYEAQAIGGDLAITLEDFAAVLADTGVADQLTSASRVDPNGYSAEDADAWIQGDGKQALERYLSFDPAESQAPIRAISEDIVGQLVGMGYDQSIAETEAERMATTFTRIAEMAGMDPMQVYEKYGPKIQRPESEAGRKVRATTQLDNMLDRLRGGDIPRQLDIFGQNLTEFLRDQGGLQDQGGELAAIDADVGRQAFEKRLIQETGMTLDDAAEKAVEAGYMQERDPNLLLDLINREVRGEPVYAAGSANDQLRALADDLAMLDDELRSRGLDIGSLSNDEIIQALMGEQPSSSAKKDGSATVGEGNNQYKITAKDSGDGTYTVTVDAPGDAAGSRRPTSYSTNNVKASSAADAIEIARQEKFREVKAALDRNAERRPAIEAKRPEMLTELDADMATQQEFLSALDSAVVSAVNAAPEGQILDQPGTPAFDRWFGDSKVVDANGEPLVVYHGTGEEFTVFEPSASGLLGEGIYATTVRSTAEQYNGVMGDGPVMEVYASLQNPYRFEVDPDAEEALDFDSPLAAALIDLLGEDAARDFLSNADDQSRFGEEFTDILKKRGHDGVIADFGDGIMDIVAFEPWQIKSATGNRGTYDPNDPNILNQSQPAADIATAVRPAEAAAQRREAMAAEVGLAADVAEAVHQGADTDQLTGLYHSDEVAPAIERALASNEGWKYAEADMGSLSAVNKALGSNAEANRFIKAVADAYQNAFDGAPVFRRGGGRFAALAPEGFDIAAAQAKADADVAAIIEEFSLSDLADSAKLYQGMSDIGQFTDVDGVTKAAQNEIESKKPEDKENVERIEAFQARAASPEGQPTGAAKRAAEASRRSGDEKRAGSDREAEAARSALTVEAGDVVRRPAGLIPSPDEVRNTQYEARAGELGLTQPQTERFRHVTKRDTLLPEFFTDADRKETMQSALDLVTETDAPAAYASLDISNLGGMTDILGRATADKVFVEMARIAHRSLQSLDNVDVIPFRHGGDEISFVVVGADAAQVKAQLQLATLDAQRYVNAIGIDKIPHRKYPNDRNKDGAGLYPGVREIVPGDTVDAIEADADRIAEANKYKGKPKVGGEKLALAKPPARERVQNMLNQPAIQDQTDSPEFKRWFGDSKVVDENGDPLVVYHGSPVNFDAFDPEKLGGGHDQEGAGFYFTSNKKEASGYAKGTQRHTSDSKTDGPVFEVFLRIENPVPMQGNVDRELIEQLVFKANDVGSFDELIEKFEEDEDSFWESPLSNWDESPYGAFEAMVESLAKYQENPHETFQQIWVDVFGGDNAKYMRSMVELGYDGVILKNEGKHGGYDHYVVFDPKSIKSAIGNRGTFNPESANILEQPVYHGTPHKFDKFSLSAIGTGEGAQAFGWGLYFAGKRGVAEWYRDTLSGDVFRVADGGIFDPDSLEHMNVRSMVRRGDLDAAINRAKTIAESDSPVAGMAANDLSVLEDIKSRGGLTKETGGIYQVDIPEDDMLLDWDAPINEQSMAVIDALDKAGIDTGIGGEFEVVRDGSFFSVRNKDTGEIISSNWASKDQAEKMAGLGVSPGTGRDLYGTIAANEGSDKAASEYLNSIGIPGLRYLDNSSRSSGDGSRNYVIWDENVVTVQAVNDELVQARELEQRGGKAVNRGSFFYDAMNKAVIQLGEASDLTTLTHESYHLFLDVMNDLALDNKQIAGELERVRNWLSANPADMRRDAMKYAKDAGEKAIADQVQAMTDEQLAAFYQSANLSLREMPSHGAERYMTIAGLEYFARGGEMYMLEGRSPAPELNGIFRRMKQWFLQVYKSAKALKVNLSDDIRGLFDRMLATDEQIAQAADLAGYGTALTDVAGLSWTDEERERVARLTGEAREQAERALMREQIRDMQKVHQKWWDDERERVRREVLDELNKTPAYQARQMLTAARRADGSPLPAGVEQIKLDRKALADEFGADYIKRLPSPKNPGNRAPQYTYAREGGVDPTVVARQYGFDSARALVEALIDSRPVDAYVESLVDGEMRRLYPDINMTDEAAQVALEAVYNDKRAQVMLAELRKLESKVGAPETIPQLFRNKAADVVRGKAIKDIRPDLYQRKAATFEREALREAMAGNYEEALAAKQRALMHHYLYKESVKARKEAESIYDYAKRLQKKPAQERIGKAGADYLERINEILSRYEFRRVSLAALARRQRLIDWVAAKQADGEHVDIPQSVLDRAEAVNWRSVSIDELMAARDALKNLEHTARVKNRLLADKNKRELQEVVNGVVAQIDKTQGKKRGKRFFQQKKLVEAAREAGHDYAAIALNMDSILRELDGWEDLGPVYDAIKRPIDEASRNVLPAMQEEYGNKLASLYNQFFSRKEQREMVKGKWVELRGRGWISREQAISVGLNWGNEYNREAVMAGIASAEDQLSEIEVRRILDSLTKNDMDFIQSVWDMMDHDLWPQVKAAQERRTGIAPEKVKASPVVTKHGVYRGGYYPVKFDRELGWRVTAQEADEMAQQVRMGGFAKAQTSRGHTEARVGTGGNPLKLDLSVLHGHMNQVLTDLALGDAINDVARVANHRDFVAAMERSGNTWAVRAIDSWLKDVAAQEVTGSDILSKFARRVRVGFTISKLGWNMGTILLQPSGLFQSLPDVGYGNMARAIADVSRGTWNGDGSIFNQVRQRSAFMRTRAASFNKDIDATMQAMKGSGWMEAAMEHIPLVKNLAGGMGPQKASEMVKNSLMGGIVAIQQVVDTIVWLGAYEKGKSMFESDADAVQYADNVVARTQASGIFSDRTAFERGTLNNNTRQAEFVRLWTVLGSYMFAKANIAYEKTRSTSFRDPAQILKWAHDMTLLYIMEVIFIGLLRSTLPDDDDDESKAGFLVKEAGAGVLAGMPLVRDAASVMQGFQGGGALGGFWDQIGRLSVQINQGEVDAALLKSLNNAGGTIFKYPSGQINRTFDAMWRDMNGEDVGVMDYLMWRQED